MPVESADALGASSSSSASSPAPASHETNSSPIPSLKVTYEEENKGEQKPLEISPVERPVALTNGHSPVTNLSPCENGDAHFSPFRRKLANTNVLSRLREDEILSPEIKRKDECAQPSSLRSSLANLSVDGSDDGRLSPVSPLIQRFNSRSSQYRSLNLRKTSDRNQEILDRLAQLRSRLQQNQSGLESNACRKGFITRNSRSPLHINEPPRKSSESVTAV